MCSVKIVGLENAEVEISAQYCRVGKSRSGICGSVWKRRNSIWMLVLNNQQETQPIFWSVLALILLPVADIRPTFDDVTWSFFL